MRLTSIIFLLIGLWMISCNQQQSEKKITAIEDDVPQSEFAMAAMPAITEEANFPVEKLCFLNIKKNEPIKENDKIYQMIDSVFISVEIFDDNTVKGIFNQLPAEKDPTRGTFEGKINGSLIDAVYSYNTEGIDVKEQVIFELGEEEIIQKYGDFRQEKGTYYLKDLNNLQNLAPVGQTDCGG